MSGNKKLIVLLILMAVIIACVVYITVGQVKDTGLETISTNLLQIQAKAKNIRDKSIAENNSDLIIGQNVPEYLIEKFNLKYIENQENTTEEREQEDSNNKEKAKKEEDIIRILSLEDLKTLGLTNITEDMKYIVNYTTGEVYYIDGFKDEQGETKYKLSDMNEITGEKEEKEQ